jgi:two-component system chemotaxis response regulator CheB
VIVHPTLFFVIGASLGRTKALQTLLWNLTETFVPPVVIELHRGKESDEAIVDQASTEYHLLIEEANPASRDGFVGQASGRAGVGRARAGFALSTAASVQRARPSIDFLFQSATETCGRQAIGVSLAGSSRDRAEGLAAIKPRGGLTLVQDPATPESTLMPGAAIARPDVDRVLLLSKIEALLCLMVSDRRSGGTKS